MLCSVKKLCSAKVPCSAKVLCSADGEPDMTSADMMIYLR